MTESWPRRLLASLTLLVPPLIGLICIIIGVAPSGVAGLGAAGPALTLMLVYFWTIFQPRLLPPPAVFIIGFIQDVLTGAPIGMGTLVLLGVQQFVLRERRVFTARTFAIAWFGFTVVALIATTALWLLVALYQAQLVDPGPFVGQLVLSVLLYPAASWLFGQIVRLLTHLEAV